MLEDGTLSVHDSEWKDSFRLLFESMGTFFDLPFIHLRFPIFHHPLSNLSQPELDSFNKMDEDPNELIFVNDVADKSIFYKARITRLSHLFRAIPFN
jgi:hypothetical protein